MAGQFTAVIEREDNAYVARCTEVHVASQGETIEDTRKNLQEALELFFKTASSEEVKERLHKEVYVTQVKVALG